MKLRALKCAFLGYLDGVKRYKLWCIYLKPPRHIISRDMVLNDSKMVQKTSTSDIEAKVEANKLKYTSRGRTTKA